MTLLQEIKKETKDFNQILGISVKHLDSGESASFNGDKLFPTASVFKVPILVELYRQVAMGKVSLTDKIVLRDVDKSPGSGILKELSEGLEITVRDLTRLMMILSDNTATDMIVGLVNIQNVNITMRRLNLMNSVLVSDCRGILFELVGGNNLQQNEKTLNRFQEMAKGGMTKGTWSLGTEKNNVTTPNEMNRLLELIATGKADSKEGCEEILGIMAQCQTGTYRIPKYLPTSKVQMQRKTGSLPGIRNDVGVITILDTGERYLISCFTKNAPDVYYAEETIARVSRNVFEYFTKR